MHPGLWQLPLALALATLLPACSSNANRQLGRGGTSGPWDLGSLAAAPAATWGSRTGLVQEVFFAGEPFEGRSTRVFGYLGRPAGSDPGTRHPAMVLVHGGGGRAFPDWAAHWAARGYVALAMDLSGNGPRGRLPDGGPDQSDKVKFRPFGPGDIRDMWTYHAVAAVIRAHSLVRSLPDVDTRRVGLTGISWGGYLTCIVAGLDSRFRVAVPVYGCGFLGDNSVWKDGALAAMTPEARELWLRTFDPGVYLARVRCPTLFLNGTADFAYPLDSYRKSYRQVPARLRHVSVVKDLPHGHIWTFPEVDAFVDAALRGGPGLIGVGAPSLRGGRLTARLEAREARPASAHLCYTLDSGPWQKRNWTTVPAEIAEGRVVASLPDGRPLVGFFAVTDDRGLRTSSEHFEMPAE